MKKIKKGDKVQLISGSYRGNVKAVSIAVKKSQDSIKLDKGTVSTVEGIYGDKILVKGINVLKKAVKKQGFVDVTRPIPISNVMFYCSKCKKGVRIGIQVEKVENKKDDKSKTSIKRTRVCKKCGTNY